MNPLELIEWNTDKRDLLDLQRAGIPIVDTELIAPGEAFVGVIEQSGDTWLIELHESETGHDIARQRPASSEIVTVMQSPPITIVS